MRTRGHFFAGLNQKSLSNLCLYPMFRIKLFLMASLIFAAPVGLASQSYGDIEDWQNPVPRVQDLTLNYQHLAELIGDKMLLLVHPKSSYKLKLKGEVKLFNDAIAVTSLALVHAPLEEVKRVVMDYESYVDVMPRTKSVEIVQKSSPHTLVSYVLNFKIPLINLDIKYLLQHTEEANGDLSILMLEGDMEGGASRWEFIEIAKNKTLVAFTNWNDVESVGFIFKTVVNAQPDMKLTSPILSAALAMESIEEQFGEGYSSPGDQVLDQPNIPQYGENNLDLLSQLTDVGKVLLVYPSQHVRVDTEGDPVELLFVSALEKVHGGIEQVRRLSTEFSRYPEFFMQVKRVREIERENGMEVDWYYRFRFGIISIPFSYSLAYQWINENQLNFRALEGDIDYIYGGHEWRRINDQATLSFFTSASALRENPSAMMGIVKQMPKLGLMAGVSFATLLLDKQVPWLEANIQGIEYNPPWKRVNEKRRRRSVRK